MRVVTRLLALGVALLSACASPEAESRDDAGTACAVGETHGPLGSCIPVRKPQPCDNCATNADCPAGALCQPFGTGPQACLVCAFVDPPPPPEPGPPDAGVDVCLEDLCTRGSDCCPGSACFDGKTFECDKCRKTFDTCMTDEECGLGGVCVARVTPCGCDSAPHTTCEKACVSGSCAPDAFCGPDRVCAPRRCDMTGPDEHFDCPDGSRCADDPEADVHGCAPDPCVDGMACDVDGKCVAGTCVKPGRCVKLP